MVKKIILYTLAIVALLAGAFWGYLWYSRWQSFRVSMPAQSDRVLRLNLEQLGTKLLTGDKEKAAKDPFFSQLREAFKIPLNVLAFGSKSVSTNVFYIKIKIDNQEQFTAFVNEFLPKGTDSLRHNAAGTISLLHNSKDGVFMMGKDSSQKVFDLAKDFLNNKKTLPFHESKLYDIKKADSDLSSLGNMYNFNINFEAGKISGTFINNVQDEIDISLKVPKNAALALISKENLFSLLNKWGLRELMTGIPTADLKADARQGFAIYIDGETQQERNVVSYDYDDNFEKVAVNKLEMVAVPNINVKLPLSGDKGLNDLLKRKLLIGSDSVNNDLLPLWNMKYLYKSTQTLHLHSSANIDTFINDPVLLEKDADLLAWVDFEKLASYASFSDFKPVISKFKRLSVQHETGESYALELSFKDQHSNAIRQLIRMFTVKPEPAP